MSQEEVDIVSRISTDRRKVGIVTAYAGYNYGSVLQVFALSRSVTSFGYKGVVIDYLDKSQFHNLLMRLRTWRNRLFAFIKHPSLFRTFINARKNQTKVIISVPKVLKEKFSKFQNEYLCLDKDNYRKRRVSTFYAFICGSDQIWNSNAPGIGEVYYLRFTEQHKRIAYAPSFGSDTVPDFNKKRLAKYLREIPYLSVREQSGVKIIKELTGRDATLVLDPVLLAGKEFWEDNVKNIKKRNRKYMVCYFLSNATRALNIIDSISKALDLEVIWINTGVSYEERDFLPLDASPLEFVSLFMNASFACTDSFHGTAFSVMFGVPFYVFRRQYEVFSKQHTRIESFLSLMHLEQRLWNDNNETDFSDCASVDFDYSKNALLNMRRESAEYLKNALESVEKNLGSSD